jgi:hypothetical protein
MGIYVVFRFKTEKHSVVDVGNEIVDSVKIRSPCVQYAPLDHIDTQSAGTQVTNVIVKDLSCFQSIDVRLDDDDVVHTLLHTNKGRIVLVPEYNAEHRTFLFAL